MVEGWFYICKNMLIFKVNIYLNCEDLCKENDYLVISMNFLLNYK